MPAHLAIFNHSESLLLLLDQLLTRHGFHVTTHLQALTTLDEIRALKPDLIILGYFTGVYENELEIISALRRDPVLQDVPILVTTTNPDHLRRQREAQETYVTIVEKPFDARQLVRNIREVLAAKA